MARADSTVRGLSPLSGLGLLATIVVTAAVVPGPGSPAVAAVPGPFTGPDFPAATPARSGGRSIATVSAGSRCERMRDAARVGNSRPSLEVRSIATGRRICSLNPRATRYLASNTKLFTTATALGRLGADTRLSTRVLARDPIEGGVLDGNLYLRGDGDPGLGAPKFLDAYFGGGGTDLTRLALQLRKRGLRKVTGRIYGDESVFDLRRGVADSGFLTSPWIGPLSGLSMNAGYTGASLSSFSANPARLAARTLTKALRKRGVSIPKGGAVGTTPRSTGLLRLAEVDSERLAWIANLANVYSNNFFAEMLVKSIGAKAGRSGSTAAGVRVVKSFARSLGARVSPVDGSGLTVSNSSSASEVVDLLISARSKSWGQSFVGTLPVAGREGTVADRMRAGPAEGRCRTKTGTLTGVSVLSGYCFTGEGGYAFSVLMNGVRDTYAARSAQDRVANLVAGL